MSRRRITKSVRKRRRSKRNLSGGWPDLRGLSRRLSPRNIYRNLSPKKLYNNLKEWKRNKMYETLKHREKQNIEYNPDILKTDLLQSYKNGQDTIDYLTGVSQVYHGDTLILNVFTKTLDFIKASPSIFNKMSVEKQRTMDETLKRDMEDKNIRVQKFKQAYEDINVDYPGLIGEYLWYYTLSPDKKKDVIDNYKSAGFNSTHWTGDVNLGTFKPVEGLNNGNLVNDQGYVVNDNGTYGHKDLPWSCTIRQENDYGHIPPGIGHHISMAYSYSLPVLLLDGGEQHWIPDRNACGPGTKIELRLSKYWAILPLLIFLCGYKMKGTYPWNKPINSTDACCMKHDQEYSIKGQSSKDIQMADWAMLFCIKHGLNEDTNDQYGFQEDTYDQQIKNKIIKHAILGKGLGEWIYGTKGWYGLVTKKHKPDDNSVQYREDDDKPKSYKEFETRTLEMLRLSGERVRAGDPQSVNIQIPESIHETPQQSQQPDLISSIPTPLQSSKSIGRKRKKRRKRKKPITKRKKPITKRKKHSNK